MELLAGIFILRALGHYFIRQFSVLTRKFVAIKVTDVKKANLKKIGTKLGVPMQL